MTQSTLPTTERLALALEALNDPRLKDIIANARAGHYDDYKSEYVAPQIKLIVDLTPYGHTAFCQRVKDGEFDGTPQESEAWAQSQTDPDILEALEWMKSQVHEEGTTVRDFDPEERP